MGWVDIIATIALASTAANITGCRSEAEVLNVRVTYTPMKNGDFDVFPGNRMPTMEADVAPYREEGSVETFRTNLDGVEYT